MTLYQTRNIHGVYVMGGRGADCGRDSRVVSVAEHNAWGPD